MLLSRRWRVSGGGRSPRKRRASVASTARRSRPPVFGRWGASRGLSRRGGGARAAAVDRDRVRARIRPASGANPDIPSLREHWLRTKYASRKALSCRMRGKSCRLALRAARAARCAIFAAVASYKERCWKKTGLLACGVFGPCVLVREQRPLGNENETPDRSIYVNGTGFVPHVQLIGCLCMSGAVGFRTLLHRQRRTRCHHAAAAPSAAIYPLVTP